MDPPVLAGPQVHYVLDPDLRNNFGLFETAGIETVWVRVLSEVLYMRAAQITIRTVPAEPDKPQNWTQAANPENAVTAESLGLETPEGEPGRTELDPAYAAVARATSINRALADNGTDATTTSFVRFLSLSDEMISLRRTWRHGLAIGARGVTLEVDVHTGEVCSLHWMGGQPE